MWTFMFLASVYSFINKYNFDFTDQFRLKGHFWLFMSKEVDFNRRTLVSFYIYSPKIDSYVSILKTAKQTCQKAQII